MFCSNCGKEITDDSIFCYSCGSKIEIKEKQDTPIETDDEKSNQPVSSPLTKTKEKSGILSKYGYGWIVLLIFYGYGLSISLKNDPFSGKLYSIIIIFLGLVVILPIYFWIRKYLVKKNFWKVHIGFSSCLSGVISYIVVSFLVSGLISFIGNYEKRKEIEEFMINYKSQMELVKKQEIEYSKMMISEPKTVSEFKNKISNIDDYKNFLKKKNDVFVSMIKFFREMNLKYKKDKSVDEQINQLDKISRDIFETSIYSTDMYKEYLKTDDEKYFILHQQGYEKIISFKDKITKITTNITKSLEDSR